mgnify:CR=1 FL=1
MWLFIGSDPGGINAISPIFLQMKDMGLDVHFFVPSHREAFAKAKGIQVKCLDTWIVDSIVHYDDFFQAYSPTGIITGTSAFDRIEVALWKEARSRGVKSFAVLDYWGNYARRFLEVVEGDSFQTLGVENIKSCYPDIIFVMNDLAYTDMIKVGVPKEKMLIYGNPHFEGLSALRDGSNIEKPKNIALMSEPLDALYNTRERFGFDEYDVIAMISKWNEGDAHNNMLLLKAHPKQQIDKSKIGEQSLHLVDTDSIELIQKSDIVFGTLTTALIEALLLGKRVCSVIPNAAFNEYSTLEKLGFKITASTPVEIDDILRKQPSETEIKQMLGIVDKGCKNIVDKIITAVNTRC